MKNLLPLGSVVGVGDEEKKWMIYGRIQKNLSDNRVYDYLACEYPIGTKDTSNGVMFNNEDISRIFYIGFQDAEAIAYGKALSKFLEENPSLFDAD